MSHSEQRLSEALVCFLPVTKLIMSPMSTTVEELSALYHMYDREYNPFSPTGLLEDEEKHLILSLSIYITVHAGTDLQVTWQHL